MMNKSEFENPVFSELQNRIDELVSKHLHPPRNPIDIIVDKTSFSKKFVSYIVNSVNLHYNNIDYLERMVLYVADECKRQRICIDLKSNEIPARIFNQIKPICGKLKDDIAFSVCDPESLANEPVDDFPLLTRFAIVATYCASYNPPITDRRFFFSGKDVLKRKQKVGASKKLHEKCHEIGPRTFEHQRAMFIFLYFCKNFGDSFGDLSDYELQADFTSQVTHLVANGFLKVVSARENFDSPIYQSLCKLDFVKRIARSISKDFNLERDYLFDFALD